MTQLSRKILNDITEIFIDFFKAPLSFLKSNFQRKPRDLLIYAGIIFIAIGLLGMGLSLLDGLGDVPGLLRAVLEGSLISYVHLLLICSLIYLFYKHLLKENTSNSEWVSIFFLASIPFWVACVLMNFLTRAVLAFSGGGFELIFYSFIFMEILRFMGLVYVLHNRFPKQRNKIFAWVGVLLVFFIVNYPKLRDSYAMLTFDLDTLPNP